jgi:hypothetical protein
VRTRQDEHLTGVLKADKKSNKSRRGQILAVGLGLVIGLVLIVAYFLSWQFAVAIAFLATGIVLLTIEYLN